MTPRLGTLARAEVSVASDDVTLRFDGEDSELAAVLDRIQSRISTVEDKLDKLNVAGRAAGDGIDAGMSKAAKATDKAGTAAEKTSVKLNKAGDDAVKAGAKAGASSSGWDDLTKKLDKTSSSINGFGSIGMTLILTGLTLGAQTLGSAVGALGATSAIAGGQLGVLSLNLLNIAPTMLAAKAAMEVFKLTATQLKGPLDQIKGDFGVVAAGSKQVSSVGDAIAKGGLLTGVQTLATDLKSMSTVFTQGMTQVGAVLGFAAGKLGNFVEQSSTLDAVRAIFAGLAPILDSLLQGLLDLLPGALALLKALLPSTQAMAVMFKQLAQSLSAWIEAESANGNITNWMITAFQRLNDVGRTVWNFAVGLFAIFRDGAQVTTGVANGMENMSAKFRAWATSASGQQQITKYFQDAIPIIDKVRQILDTLGHTLGGLASGAGTSSLAGLLTLIENVAKILAGLNFGSMNSQFSVIIGALTQISNWILWLQQNIPGLNTVLSALMTGFLLFKAVGPIFAGVSGAIKGVQAVYTFFTGAATAESLTLAGVIAGVGSAMETMGIVGLIALDGLSAAIDAAFVATPIGWIVLAIVAVIAIVVVLWEKCAWFRDAVEAVWNAIKIAAVAVWDFIKQAAIVVFDFIVAYIKAWVTIITAIWHGLVAAAEAIWHGLVVAWQAVWSVLLPVVQVVWDVIKFVIQVVVYIIVGLITLIALAAQGVWFLIKAGAEWLWNTILHPIFNLIATVATTVWQGIVTIATWAWNLVVAGALWFWNTILHPIFILVSTVALWVWQGIVTAAQWCWNLIVAGAQWFWNTILHPIFSLVASVGSTIWSGITTAASAAWNVIKGVWSVVSGWFKGLWDGISGAAKAAWGGISDAASTVGKVVSGVWNTIVGAVKAVWNFIAKGWNSIPDITVPSWVPLIGGKSFGLPKLPVLYAGGPTPGGPAVVGEHGPELLVRDGQITQMLGARGPEIISDLPRGGYVVPNIATITAGMAKPIPAPIAAAVARSGARGESSGDPELRAAIRELTATLRERPPPLAVNGGDDTRKAVLDALRERDRENDAKKRYTYVAGQG